MNEQEENQVRLNARPRGRMMDFAPKGIIEQVSVRTRIISLSDEEQRRREIARREVARREEIHRQIERQKEQDLIDQRRAVAAKKDLARRMQIEREKEKAALIAHKKELELRRAAQEKAERHALMEARAMRERQRILLERRKERARRELERRREAENEMPTAPTTRKVENPISSKDPLARTSNLSRITVADAIEASKKPLFRKPLIDHEKIITKSKQADHLPVQSSARPYDRSVESERDFETELAESELGENYDIDELEEGLAENNTRYVLGGRSPFINTEVEKRPLSGGDKTYESTASAIKSPAKEFRSRFEKLKSGTKTRSRYVPYQEPLPHKNIYARTVAKERDRRDTPTMVVSNVPKGSKIPLIIAIALTVIFGAVIGVVAYLALFQ
jgi:hypothetical protein